MKILICLSIFSAFICSPIKAATNFVGDVNAQYGSFYATNHVYAIGGLVYAGAYVTTPGYVQAGKMVTGSGTVAGSYGSAFGVSSNAGSYSCVVVGRNNKDQASDGAIVVAGSWVDKDPLFVAGNGADSTHPNNAFAIYKDGTVTMSKAQGDILMGQFGN